MQYIDFLRFVVRTHTRLDVDCTTIIIAAGIKVFTTYRGAKLNLQIFPVSRVLQILFHFYSHNPQLLCLFYLRIYQSKSAYNKYTRIEGVGAEATRGVRGVGVPESEGKATWSGFLGKLRATTRSPFNIQPNRPGSDRNFVLESFTRDFAQRSEAFDFALCRYREARLHSAYLLIRPLPPNFLLPRDLPPLRSVNEARMEFFFSSFFTSFLFSFDGRTSNYC